MEVGGVGGGAAGKEALGEIEHVYSTEETRSALRYASAIADRNGYVILQMLNAGFVDFTKSWVCNVRRFPGILDRTLFVATDRESYVALTSFQESGRLLHVALHEFDAPSEMKYGQLEYYSYMLHRTDLLLNLLGGNVTTWLTEADAAWLEDPTALVLGTKGDVVAMSDNSRRVNFMANGGFQLLRPTEATRRAWQMLREEQGEEMSQLRSSKSSNYSDRIGNEQLIMHRLRQSLGDRLKTGWLPVDRFISGNYYKMKRPPTSPAIILNNWISGNEKKKRRAREWGHWYLSDDSRHCMSKMVVSGQQSLGT